MGHFEIREDIEKCLLNVGNIYEVTIKVKCFIHTLGSSMGPYLFIT